MAGSRNLAHDETLCFRGLARVDLNSLDFEYAYAGGHRHVQSSNVRRLVEAFRAEGCHRNDPLNYEIGRAHV